MTNKESKPQPGYMTVAEVAEELSVSKMTIYRLIKEGELTVLKVGGSNRIPPEAFAAFIIRNTINARTD